MKWVIGLIVVVILVSSFVFYAIAQQKAEMPKNVQVLKGKTTPEVMQIMATSINPGLGFQCSSCHEVKDFSSDAKPEKIVARKMLKMVSEVNQNYFADPKLKQVTCYMCHRGKEEPLTAASEMKKK
ncbi:MAG: c-type cytochrome [bacterium]